MATGSFPEGTILQFASQSINLYYGSNIIFALTYPIGYSGSISQQNTPTGSIIISGSGTGSTIPTVGQIWPRGNRGV